MSHARAILRAVETCDQEGDRKPLHNFILQKYNGILSSSPEHWEMIPDPADDCTDDEWLRASIDALSFLHSLSNATI